MHPPPAWGRGGRGRGKNFRKNIAGGRGGGVRNLNFGGGGGGGRKGGGGGGVM